MVVRQHELRIHIRRRAVFFGGAVAPEEDEEEFAEQEAYFSGIGADGRPTSPVREAIAIHPEDPTYREEAHFPVLHPNVDQTESTHRTEVFDATD